MRYVVLLLLIFHAAISYADIYMQTDKNGNITYSDVPLSNSQKIILPDINSSNSNLQTVPDTTPVDTLEKNTVPVTVETAVEQPYTEFAILSPKDQETIQNQPTISVKIALKPALRPGDTIQLLLDGKMTGPQMASTSLGLTLLERGTHQLSAIVLNANQQVLQQTNPITIYVQRANVNTSPAFRNSANKPGFFTRLKQLF